MSNALRQTMTVEEFLDWERRQPVKYEFDGIQPVAMTGGSLAHARVQRNLAISIGGALRGGPCEFIGSDLQLRLAHTVRYPDGMVICGPQAGSAVSTSEPVVIFEVLSPSTAGVDRIVKVREYQALASVQRYVILEQDRTGATVFARAGEQWSGQVLVAGDTLDLPEAGIQVSLDELYLDVELPASDAE